MAFIIKGKKMINEITGQTITIVDVAFNVSEGRMCVVYRVDGEDGLRIRNNNDFEHYEFVLLA
jgi:hypothetical protein